MFTVSLNRVMDHIAVKEGEEQLSLFVDDDANSLVRKLMQAKRLMDAVKADTTEADKLQAAKTFASAIFGEDQAEQLALFYHDNAGSIAEVCSRYFDSRLAKMITKAQIKTGKREAKAWRRGR